MDKVPADGHGSGIEAVQGVHDRIADLQQAILGNISPVGVAGRAICTKSVVLAGQVHIGSVVHRIGGGDSPGFTERERRCGMVHAELGVNRRVVQAEGINAAPYRSILRVRENAVHEGVHRMVRVFVGNGIVDGVGGNAVEAVTHGIALALRHLVPGDGELVRRHVIKSREFGVLRERCLRTARRLAVSLFERPAHHADVRTFRDFSRIATHPLETRDEHGTVGVHHRI